MLEIALEITLCLLIAALIGFILGFIVAKATSKKENKENTSKNSKNETTKTKKTEVAVATPAEEKTIEEEIDTLIETIAEEETPEEVEIPTSDVTQNAVEALKGLDETEAEEAQKPVILDAPRDNQKDALTQIKGIGPKVEDQLNAAGIYHFEQIANWNESNILWLEVNTTFAHRAKKDLWVNQAKALI